MQDPLSFTFCWGETFDTAPSECNKPNRLYVQVFRIFHSKMQFGVKNT